MADERKPNNWLKVRADSELTEFITNNAKLGSAEFITERPTWVSGEHLTYSDLRSRIEPWLTALFQSEHLSLLAGSGLTYAVSGIALPKPEKDKSSETEDENVMTLRLVDRIQTEGVFYYLGQFQSEKFETIAEGLRRTVVETAVKAGRSTPNIEDELRITNELLRGLEILDAQPYAKFISTIIKEEIEWMLKSILRDERNLATGINSGVSDLSDGEAPQRSERAFNTLVTFLMSFASRTGTRDRLNIFTTNYDRVIEMGAELAGLHLLDRFVGNLTPIFRSSRLSLDLHYNPPGIRGEPRYLEGVARFTKLHGSVDWVQVGRDIRRIGLPFGAEDAAPYLKAPGLHNATPHSLMIYPNAAKDRETAAYPYVDLFRDFAAAACRPNHTLVVYGYSFGDEHINRVIEDMLTIPSTHLVIISYDDPLGRILEFYKQGGRAAQISLLVGPALADLELLTQYFLPKPSIDKASFRMGELLKQRMGERVERSDITEEVKGIELSTDAEEKS